MSVEIFFVRLDTVQSIFQTNDASHEFYAFEYFVDCKIDDGIKAELYDNDIYLGEDDYIIISEFEVVEL